MMEQLRYRPSESPFHFQRIIIGGANISGSITALRLANVGKDVTLIDPINIAEVRTPACDGCGGLIQKITRQQLANIGFPIPENIIRRTLNGYIVHFPTGETITVNTDLIAVHRGHGPKNGVQYPGLDSFLFNSALKLDGVRYIQDEVINVEVGIDGKARVHLKNNKFEEGDFFVAAVGHNLDLIQHHIKTPLGYTLDAPTTRRSSVNEINISETDLSNYFGDAAHVVMVPLKEAHEKYSRSFSTYSCADVAFTYRRYALPEYSSWVGQ